MSREEKSGEIRKKGRRRRKKREKKGKKGEREKQARLELKHIT